MYTFGIDIGSTTSKCIVLEDGKKIVGQSLLVGGIGTKAPQEARETALKMAGITEADVEKVTATGYGRNRIQEADYNVSELSCHALGAHTIFPSVRTIIDIGGQDAKVISLNEEGRMMDFMMNDKCAAGTGRFLDVMANVLQIGVDEISDLVKQSEKPAKISSTCTVFAESEVISQLANGETLPDILAGICDSVSSRVSAIVKRVGVIPDLCMSGGVAQNEGVRNALSRDLDCPILFSEKAQLFGAIGAALYGYRKAASGRS